MKNWKECQVVSIHSQVSELHIEDDGTMHIDPELASYGGLKHFHLYVLSDDEIKVGDWYYFESEKEEFISKCESIDRTKQYWLDNDISAGAKKIIASTNPTQNLPRLSTEFINSYCAGGGIGKVHVEYEVVNSATHEPCIKLYDLIVYDNNINIEYIDGGWYTHTESELKELLHKCWIQATRKTLEPMEEMGFGGWIKTIL